MSDYLEEYNIAGRHYGIKDREADHVPVKRYQCWAGGCSICEGHKSLRQAHDHLIDYVTEYLHAETDTADARQREICAALTQLVQKPGRGSGRRENNLIPFMTRGFIPFMTKGQATKKKTVDVRIGHDFSYIGATEYVSVTMGPEGVKAHNYLFGLPIGAFDVPTETGREYRLTIEELPGSNPEPVENPWRKGEFA